MSEFFEFRNNLTSTYKLLSANIIFSILVGTITHFVCIEHINLFLLSPLMLVCMLITIRKPKWNVYDNIYVFMLSGIIGFFFGLIPDHHVMNLFDDTIYYVLSTLISFLSLSGYILKTKKDMSFIVEYPMRTGIISAIIVFTNVFLMYTFLDVPLSTLFIYCTLVLFASVVILRTTSQLIRKESIGYTESTISLFLAICLIYGAL